MNEADIPQDGARTQKTQQNKFWLQNNVNDILEPMMHACCQNAPDNEVSSLILS